MKQRIVREVRPGQFPESDRHHVFTPLCDMYFGRPVSTNPADVRPTDFPWMMKFQNEAHMNFPFESVLYNNLSARSRFSTAPVRHAIAMPSDTLHTQRTLSVSL